MINSMEWLNYHHLLYFWLTAREGTVAAAAELLHLTRSTVTGQIRELERSFGHALFQKEGRYLSLTEFGRMVYSYADEIFTTGQELQALASREDAVKTMRLVVGIPDVVPKLVAYLLLKPALQLEQRVQLVCYEGKLDDLLADLALHRLDLVLSDAPASATLDVNAFNHKLGECGTSFFATLELAEEYRETFPESLAHAPLLIPTQQTALRRALNQWFDQTSIRPNIVAEFEDSALMKVFGQSGLGIFPAPSAIEEEIQTQYRVELVGQVDEVRDQFFAISVERRLKHPAVLAISQAARSTIFKSNS